MQWRDVSGPAALPRRQIVSTLSGQYLLEHMRGYDQSFRSDCTTQTISYSIELHHAVGPSFNVNRGVSTDTTSSDIGLYGLNYYAALYASVASQSPPSTICVALFGTSLRGTSPTGRHLWAAAEL